MSSILNAPAYWLLRFAFDDPVWMQLEAASKAVVRKHATEDIGGVTLDRARELVFNAYRRQPDYWDALWKDGHLNAADMPKY